MLNLLSTESSPLISKSLLNKRNKKVVEKRVVFETKHLNLKNKMSSNSTAYNESTSSSSTEGYEKQNKEDKIREATSTKRISQ